MQIKKLTRAITTLLVLIPLLTHTPTPAQADQSFTCTWDGGGFDPTSISFTASDATVATGESITVTFTGGDGVFENTNYYLDFEGITKASTGEPRQLITGKEILEGKQIVQTVADNEAQTEVTINFYREVGFRQDELLATCTPKYNFILPSCSGLEASPKKAQVRDVFTFTTSGLTEASGLFNYQMWYNHEDTGLKSQIGSGFNTDTSRSQTFERAGMYRVSVLYPQGSQNLFDDAICTTFINVCENIDNCAEPPPDPSASQPSLSVATFNLCNMIAPEDQSECNECFGDNLNNLGVWTAVGCIKVNPAQFAQDIFRLALSIAGGIAMLLIIYASFLIATSADNPETFQRGKEVLTGAIIGLLFIIFSVVILNFIGVAILQIPGF